VPALRLHFHRDQTALLDRGSMRRLEGSGKKIAARMAKTLEIATELADGDPNLKPRLRDQNQENL
jgi:hypothetical protein